MKLEKILYEDVYLDAQVLVKTDANLVVAPLPYEWEKTPLMPAEHVVLRGSLLLKNDGTAEFRRYRTRSKGPLYHTVYQTEHCSVKLTRKGQLVEVWKFGRQTTPHQMYEIRKRERRDVDAFFKTVDNMFNNQ